MNVERDHVLSADDLELLPGAADAIRQINRSEYLAVLVTNQPAIAKGWLSESGLRRIHDQLETLLGAEHAYLDRIYYCPHHPEKGFEGEVTEYKIACECRKPSPGMLRGGGSRTEHRSGAFVDDRRPHGRHRGRRGATGAERSSCEPAMPAATPSTPSSPTSGVTILPRRSSY